MSLGGPGHSKLRVSLSSWRIGPECKLWRTVCDAGAGFSVVYFRLYARSEAAIQKNIFSIGGQGSLSVVDDRGINAGCLGSGADFEDGQFHVG